MIFTPNDIVTVQLTEHGMRLALEATDKFNDHMRANHPTVTYRKSVPYDDKGQIRGQFWSVIQDVGGYHGGAGHDLVFQWIEHEQEGSK